jgi:hypothetical protein
MSEQTDIVVRLRDWESKSASMRGTPLMLLHNEAADEIEQLRLEKDRAKQQIALLQHEVCL